LESEFEIKQSPPINGKTLWDHILWSWI
jgi:hypothetical protein